jgi:hypothetical protein
MNKVLWIFIAFAFGLLLFTSIQDDLPDELGFLKSKQPAARNIEGAVTYQHEGWFIQQIGQTSEMSKPLRSPAPGVEGSLFLLCHNGQWQARINLSVPTPGKSFSSIEIGGAAERWAKGADNNLISPNPQALASSFSQDGQPLSLTIPTVSAGKVNFEFHPKGFSDIVARLSLACPV